MILDAVIILQWTALVIMWALWRRERDRRQDYATDLSQVINDHDLDSRDLRRSLRHKEIRQAVERNYDDAIDFQDYNQ